MKTIQYAWNEICDFMKNHIWDDKSLIIFLMELCKLKKTLCFQALNIILIFIFITGKLLIIYQMSAFEISFGIVNWWKQTFWLEKTGENSLISVTRK